MARPKSVQPKYCLHKRCGRGYLTDEVLAAGTESVVSLGTRYLWPKGGEAKRRFPSFKYFHFGDQGNRKFDDLTLRVLGRGGRRRFVAEKHFVERPELVQANRMKFTEGGVTWIARQIVFKECGVPIVTVQNWVQPSRRRRRRRVFAW